MKRGNLADVEWQGRFDWQKAILFNEEDLEAKGSKMQVIKLQPGGVIEPHYHKVRTEVFYVLKGQGSILLNGDEFQSKEDDFFLCQPNTTHEFRNTGTDEFIVGIFRTNDPGDADMLWVKDKE
ncbi:MAG TPA: cupin domain-containing protein [Patescibacteria group bacterium]|nr:cupin domain-containing protein [Patescibacteria group bacterium]